MTLAMRTILGFAALLVVVGAALAQREASQRVIQSVAALAFIALLVVPPLDHRFGWSNVASLLSILADVVVVIGYWTIFLVFRVNTFTAATIAVADEQTRH